MPVHITWLIQAECKCTRVIPIYEPVARVQHYCSGSPDYLLSYKLAALLTFCKGQGDRVVKLAFLLKASSVSAQAKLASSEA